MRHCTGLIVLAAFLAFSSNAFADAQGKGRGPKTPTAHAPKPTTSHGPKTTTARAPKTAKTTSPGRAKTTTARTPQASANGKKSTQVSPTPATATNLPKNPRLVERLRVRLGLPEGTDMTPYAAGFRNQGQFIAAVNVSNNLGISFVELKSLMVNDGLSLGQAIQRLRPGVNADNEVRRATSQPPR